MREIKRDIVGTFILSTDNKVMLGHNVKGGVFEDEWVIPGGGIEPGETRLEATVRETAEETGLDISGEDISFFDTVFSVKAEKTLRDTSERVMVDMTFYDAIIRLTALADDVVLVHEDDFTDGRFFSPSELSEIKIAHPTRRRLIELRMLTPDL